VAWFYFGIDLGPGAPVGYRLDGLASP
jgi:hypothetical protein